MKRILVLCAAAMLLAAPALAAQGGSQSKVVNKTDINNSMLNNIGNKNKLDVSNVTNKGGTQRDINNKTTIKNSMINNVGNENTTKVGVVENQ